MRRQTCIQRRSDTTTLTDHDSHEYNISHEVRQGIIQETIRQT